MSLAEFGTSFSIGPSLRNSSGLSCSQEALRNSQDELRVPPPSSPHEPLPIEPLVQKIRTDADRWARIGELAPHRIANPQAIASKVAKDNEGKNRYPDILPLDLDLLSDPYINANWFHNMILTQGPLATEACETLTDFWSMAFDNAAHIVCLTDYQDDAKREKTAPYWNPTLNAKFPTRLFHQESVFKTEVYVSNGEKFDEEIGEFVTIFQGIPFVVKRLFDPVRVLTADDGAESVLKRLFEIKRGDTHKVVTQWHYENWKDQKTCNPKKLAQLIRLLIQEPGKVIVHCSAGIGRAGVFAIAKVCVEQYLKNGVRPTEEEIDKLVVELRQRRPMSVQSIDQLKLISQTLDAFIAL